AMLWLGGLKGLSLDTGFANASSHASPALSIPVSPPRAALSTGADGDGKVRTAAPSSLGFAVRAGETDRIEGLMAHGRR
ncbi:hypothetical protein, partial [Methyloceanibacter methanicus]|uniref:hypothetical protein n=1 Tax=Methyloceanibacter methanicus TaxID=1774968 RepID=UPI00130111E3